MRKQKMELLENCRSMQDAFNIHKKLQEVIWKYHKYKCRTLVNKTKNIVIGNDTEKNKETWQTYLKNEGNSQKS